MAKEASQISSGLPWCLWNCPLLLSCFLSVFSFWTSACASGMTVPTLEYFLSQWEQSKSWVFSRNRSIQQSLQSTQNAQSALKAFNLTIKSSYCHAMLSTIFTLIALKSGAGKIIRALCATKSSQKSLFASLTSRQHLKFNLTKILVTRYQILNVTSKMNQKCTCLILNDHLFLRII